MSVCVLWWIYTITKERCWYYTWEIWGHLGVLYFLGDRHKQDERYSEVSLVVSKYMWQQVCECWKEERVFLEVGRILKDTRSGWFYVDLGKASYFCFLFFFNQEKPENTQRLVLSRVNLTREESSNSPNLKPITEVQTNRTLTEQVWVTVPQGQPHPNYTEKRGMVSRKKIKSLYSEDGLCVLEAQKSRKCRDPVLTTAAVLSLGSYTTPSLILLLHQIENSTGSGQSSHPTQQLCAWLPSVFKNGRHSKLPFPDLLRRLAQVRKQAELSLIQELTISLNKAAIPFSIANCWPSEKPIRANGPDVSNRNWKSGISYAYLPSSFFLFFKTF